jgi:hypothetical protein
LTSRDSPPGDSINRSLSDDLLEIAMNRTVPSTLTVALVLLVILGAALAAGCTTTTTTTAKGTIGPTPTPAGTTAGTAAAVTTSGPSGSGSAAVAAVSYDRLLPFIPKTAGAWSLESDAQGMTMKDAEGHEYTWVTGTYTKDGDENAQADIVIQDAAVANTPYKQQWKSFTSYESTEGSMKSVTVKGQPAWQTYDKSTNNNGLMAFVGDRYIVFMTVEDGTKADLDTLVNAMDFAGLAAVK